MALPPAEAALISRQLAEVARAAQERIGLTAALVAYTAWQYINPSAPTLSGAYVNEVLNIAHVLRRLSHRLAARSYNLQRAIGSGFAYPDVDGAFGEHDLVTLEVLYGELAEVLNEVIIETSLGIAAPPTPAERRLGLSDTFGLPDLSGILGLRPEGPLTEEAPMRGRKLDARLEQLGDSLAQMLRESLPSPAGLDEPVDVEKPEEWDDWIDFGEDGDLDAELLKKLDEEFIQELDDLVRSEKETDHTFAESLEVIEEAADKKGANGAARVAADGIAPGRMVAWEEGNRDSRRYAWMRVTGPRPCAFCAMLASRGAVYQTAESAGYNNLYHPNCMCAQTPLFVTEPHYSERDEFFIDGWRNEISKRYSGREALRQWRKWLDDQYRQGLVPEQDVFGPARSLG